MTISNSFHTSIVDGINRANGLPDMRSVPQALQAMKDAGFEILSHGDCALNSPVPWYYDLKAGWFTHQVRNVMVDVLEFLRVAPKGTSNVHKMLVATAADLVNGGETGTFTPMYLIVGRKPARK